MFTNIAKFASVSGMSSGEERIFSDKLLVSFFLLSDNYYSFTRALVGIIAGCSERSTYFRLFRAARGSLVRLASAKKGKKCAGSHAKNSRRTNWK